MTHSKQPLSIQGVYEACIGVDDLDAQIQYWSAFGYQPSIRGTLQAEEAQRLYNVDSELESIRLSHQEADHGLVRLMKWSRPTGSGLGLAPMRTAGGRWTASLTEDAMRIMNHVGAAREQGLPIKVVPPQWAVIYEPSEGSKPFHDPLIGVREMFVCHPLTRQILFQRFNYQIEHYGQVNPDSLLQCSQITHFGLLFKSDDPTLVSFYQDTLGLLFIREAEDTYETSRAGRAIFDLQPGDRYVYTDFDDPRSHATDYRQARSGRLKILRWDADSEVPQGPPARPGVLGLSLYTYRVSHLDMFYARVSESAATQVTEITLDEFGARAFSFIAPDGYDWTLIEDPSL